MKRHGNYILPTPEELACDLGIPCDQASEYVRKQLQRHRQKHRNEKRHKAKSKGKTRH